jgi:hypothetical protein
MLVLYDEGGFRCSELFGIVLNRDIDFQMRKIQVITLFPEMFDGVLNSSMMWKAQKQQAIEFKLVDLRDFGLGSRKQVDDTP